LCIIIKCTQSKQISNQEKGETSLSQETKSNDVNVKPKKNKSYKKKHDLKEIFSTYWQSYLKSDKRKLKLASKHIEAVNKIGSCRTEKLGGAIYVCEGCGLLHYMYRSCKHRFCSTCGIVETNRWAREKLDQLLKIKHHHVVMTLPKGIRYLSKINGDLIHNLLFRISSQVIKTWFKKKHELDCGIVSVLHTAGSDLKYHPHVHMIVSGGGIKLKGEKEELELEELSSDWLCKQRYLAKQFRWHFERGLLKLYEKGELKVSKRIETRIDFLKQLRDLNEQDWIVSIQKPLSDATAIVRYVGRYTKRACISEYKIESIGDDKISFRYNDYKNTPRGEKPKQSLKIMSSTEFLDSLLQHVPNKRFRMVRYYGIYSSSKWKLIPEKYKHQSSQQKLEEQLRELEHSEDWGEFEAYRKTQILITGNDPLYCKGCKRAYKLWQVIIPTAKKKKKKKRQKSGTLHQHTLFEDSS